MIGYLNGRLLRADAGNVILEVGGVGFELACSSSAYAKLVNNGGGEVYTYLQVRDDGMSLYGFDSVEEKNMFLKLITVSGVGPKMGIGILSAMNLSQLALAIASSDVKSLSTIKGCGKKTAERIVLELREKVSALDLPESGGVLPTVADADEDAVIALMTLGFTRSESTKAVASAEDSGASGIENVIAAALKSLAGH